MKNNENYILFVEDNFKPFLEEECKNLKPIIKSFVENYVKYKDDMELNNWLAWEIKRHLDDISDEEAQKISKEIIESIEIAEENKNSLKNAINQGRSKESWFASKIKKITSHMSTKETVDYLQSLDNQISKANIYLDKTITTKAGNVSKNPNLDGFIAEQYHAQTFNLNAESVGSEFRAEVLEPTGNAYTKNSVDLVIKDGNGKVVRRYQSKYCKDVESTKRAFDAGDYRGQRKLVADGQEELIQNASNVIESPDGVTSNSLSKDDAIKMRDEAQSGKFKELDWNEYKTKDVAIGIGKKTGYAALQGAVIGTGMEIAKKVWNGEEIKGEDVIKSAVETGTEFGVKAAVSGALKVGAEKGIINVIPKGTPAGVVANIAQVGIENAKIAMKLVKGEIDLKEAIEEAETTTVSVVAGLASSAKATTIGATIGSVLGPVGTVVGGFVGGTVGYMMGSKVGEVAVEGGRKIKEYAKEKFEYISEKISSAPSKVFSTVSSGFSSVVSGVRSLFS